MARKKPEEHQNHERWLVSYADFITLLFAFFVVMFASSQTDKSRAQEVSDAVEKALKEGHTISVPPAVARILGGTVDEKGSGNAQMKGPGGAQKAAKEEIVEMTAPLKTLTEQLDKEIKQGKVEVSLQPRGLVVSMKQAAFFPSGSDVLLDGSYPILEKLSGAIKALPNGVRIEGHTDAQPIHSSRFPSNWELSSARAITMMNVLTDRYDVANEMEIAGYADKRPIAPNDTVEGRARNRRVDLVLLNRYAGK